ncbi:MAG TPA: chromosomal replication initiator protein DnaA [Microbacteriaceae bacterium]|nr:chromosomal replication initiator protein DnaA [Microbacteriaceae bacterium]
MNDPNVGPAFGAQLSLAIPRGLTAGMLYLAVQHDFTQRLLEHQLRHTIMNAISQTAATELIENFVVLVDPEVTLQDVTRESIQESASRNEESRFIPMQSNNSQRTIQQHERPLLNERYKFDTFVIGQSNRFAHAAAVAVAEAPAKAYNPLFIYGDSGLGKTHLLHAIGHYAQELFPKIRVKYVSTEDFTNDFINSIANNQGTSFHQRYRSVEILLVDDIQFLEGKAETQEAFFHTFNTLHAQNKQVVITSDVQPKQLKGFEERMLSRFEWGLLTDIQIPDLETRIAILRKKCQYENLVIDDSILEYIASKLSSNIRELEGTLIRVAAFANLNDKPVDLDLVQTVLKDVISLDDDSEISPADIIALCANYFNIPIDDLIGPSRAQEIAFARQVAMYLCRDLTSLSLPKIGQLFSGRDHTTVMYAHKKITQLITARRSVYNQIAELTAQLKQKI